MREKKEELRRLAGEGRIAAKGKGARLRLRVGAFYDWLGQDVPVVPDCGIEHEVYPDRERAHVESLLSLRRHAQDTLAHAPGRLDERLDLERPAPDEEGGPGWGDELARALASVLRERIQARWGEVRAIEVAVAEVAEEFDGEPVLRPDVQAMVDGIKAQLVELPENIEPFAGPFELPEPGSDDVELVRKLIERVAEL